jgi:hypothetical protein
LPCEKSSKFLQYIPQSWRSRLAMDVAGWCQIIK